MNAPDTKLPPHSIEAEQSLLGSLLLDNGAFERVRDLGEEDFYGNDHRRIFRAIAAILEDGDLADIVTVGDFLQNAGEIEQAGGRHYLGLIANNTPSPANIRAYADTIQKRVAARRLMAAADDLKSGALNGEDLADVAELTRARLDEAINPVLLRRGAASKSRYAIRDVMAQRSTVSEMARAPLTPRCIVDGYLYSDVAVLAGPGAVGKSTLQLYEAVCVILGRPVWGHPVVSPGPILYVTAEDERSRILSRMWHVMQAMGLREDVCTQVAENFYVHDVCGEDLRLVRSAVGGDIVQTEMADEIVTAYRGIAPVLCILDPLVSFGADEGRVNVNEQALVTAMRRIRRGLDCCVRAIHHTGQEAALAKRTDQYAARGGTALPDGSRMVTIAHAWQQGDAGTPPMELLAGETHHTTYIRLSRPKLSFVAPQPAIWVRREGWAYRYAIEARLSPEEAAREKQVRAIAQLSGDANQVERFITDQLGQGRKHTSRTLETVAASLGIGRQRLRDAVSELIISGRVRNEPLPLGEKKGRRKDYLCPMEAPNAPNAPLRATNSPAHLKRGGAVARIKRANAPFPIGGAFESGAFDAD